MASCTGLGGTGTRYTYAQLEGLWINAGGPAAVAPVAAAIALAESGGCSTALNPTDNNGTQSSFGLWQISNGTHTAPVADIYSPAVNASQAVGKYRSAGDTFADWGTYVSGAYEAFLSPGTTPQTTGLPAAAQTAGDTNTEGTPSTPGGCLISIPSVDLKITSVGGGCLLGKVPARAILGGGLMVLGAIPAMLGLVILAAFSFRKTGAATGYAGALEAARAVPLVP